MSALASVSEQDLRRLLDVVSPERVEVDGSELPQQVLAGLAELIPSARVSFFVTDSRGRRVAAGQELVLADLPPDAAESNALFFDACWDCVDCSWPERTGDHERVTMWTDFYSEREYARLLMAERRTVPAPTPRQLQLLRRVADGHTNRQIAPLAPCRRQLRLLDRPRLTVFAGSRLAGAEALQP